jgi:hypothetical protein
MAVTVPWGDLCCTALGARPKQQDVEAVYVAPAKAAFCGKLGLSSQQGRVVTPLYMGCLSV